MNINNQKGLSREEILKKLENKRTRPIVYTRVMGYHRPVESFNVGKKGEHKERVQFIEKHPSNTHNIRKNIGV